MENQPIDAKAICGVIHNHLQTCQGRMSEAIKTEAHVYNWIEQVKEQDKDDPKLLELIAAVLRKIADELEHQLGAE